MKQTARQIREQANQWRTLAWVFVSLALIGSLWTAVSTANAAGYLGGSSFDGGVFLGSLIVFFGASLVVLLPYFMITQAMDGIASILDHVEPASAPAEPRAPGVLETFLKGTSSPPAHRDKVGDGGLSVRARRVAGVLGALGGATYEQIADKLEIDIGAVDPLIQELRTAGLAARSEGGVYRYVSPSRETAPVTATVPYCETCGYVINETEAVSSHRGHQIGTRDAL